MKVIVLGKDNQTFLIFYYLYTRLIVMYMKLKFKDSNFANIISLSNFNVSAIVLIII